MKLWDYAMELDETCIRNVAHLMVASLVGSLGMAILYGSIFNFDEEDERKAEKLEALLAAVNNSDSMFLLVQMLSLL